MYEYYFIPLLFTQQQAGTKKSCRKEDDKKQHEKIRKQMFKSCIYNILNFNSI
jgi:hypothetical protein